MNESNEASAAAAESVAAATAKAPNNPPARRGAAASATTIPEVSAPAELPAWVRSKRAPCVLRSVGSELELTKGLLHAAASDDGSGGDGAGTGGAAEGAEGGGGGGGGGGGIRWLASQTGSTTFRVFVSGPLVAGNCGRDDGKVDGKGGSDCVPSPPTATFTLDGTDHPDSILTTSMSRSMTLHEMISCGEDQWRCRYMVEDELPHDGPMGRLVPAGPPPSVAVAFAPSSLRQRQLFFSIGPCQTQVHRDCYDNFYVCALGERHWAVAPPDDGWEREGGSVSASVQPPPPSPPLPPTTGSGGKQGKAITAAGNVGSFARVTLKAGDGLFVPANWWHSVRSNSSGPDTSVAVNWYFDALAPDQEEKSGGADDSGGRGKRRRKMEGSGKATAND